MAGQTGGDVFAGQFAAADVQRIIRCRAIEAFYNAAPAVPKIRQASFRDIHDQPWYTKVSMKRMYLKKLRALK